MNCVHREVSQFVNFFHSRFFLSIFLLTVIFDYVSFYLLLFSFYTIHISSFLVLRLFFGFSILFVLSCKL